jgi:hypothetical protein
VRHYTGSTVSHARTNEPAALTGARNPNGTGPAGLCTACGALPQQRGWFEAEIQPAALARRWTVLHGEEDIERMMYNMKIDDATKEERSLCSSLTHVCGIFLPVAIRFLVVGYSPLS